MNYLPIGREGLGQLYKAVADKTVDRILGLRLGYPSPFHDRIDPAHARMYALSPGVGDVPSRSLAIEALQDAGLPEQDILDVLMTIEEQDGRSLVGLRGETYSKADRQLSGHLLSRRSGALDVCNGSEAGVMTDVRGNNLAAGVQCVASVAAGS